jgi:hypothetical protein
LLTIGGPSAPQGEREGQANKFYHQRGEGLAKRNYH